MHSPVPNPFSLRPKNHNWNNPSPHILYNLRMSSLLAAKFHIPYTRGTTPSPKRLIQRLASDTAPFTLLSAPPGYGKTNATWYTLDTNDNDPHQFGQAIISALRPFTPVEAYQPTDLTSLLGDESDTPHPPREARGAQHTREKLMTFTPPSSS